MKGIIFLGIIIFVTSCLPRIGTISEKKQNDPISEEMVQPSLFTNSELEDLFSQENKSALVQTPAPPAEEISPQPPIKSPIETSTPSKEGQLAWGIEIPISDESSDDFSLEILKEDQSQKEKDFDIPIVINARVEQFIQYFQTTLRNRFSNWLSRSGRYIPFMRNLLRENGLPEDLVYMALIESGFNPYAYSRSKASGPWQFIYFTGKKYGLKVNWWVDERRDPEKSTIAAAKYLKDLYDMFECWYLAAAGYNAGENKIISAMKRYRTEDFWELSKYRYLKQETRDYVPQMIAAALIAKDPERYGFADIEYQEPLKYEKIIVPRLTDLRLIAEACDISLEELKDLNPEILRWFTPPDQPEYEIKIPSGKKEQFLRNFDSIIQKAGKNQFKIHRVRKGDTLKRIARLYRISPEPILEINNLQKWDRLQVGSNLLLPIPKEYDKKQILMASKNGDGKEQVPRTEIIYTIKKGDTLWSIANEMGVNIGTLSRWNQLHPEKKLIPGDRLRIKIMSESELSEESPKENGKKEVIHIVKPGDTLWSISKRYNVKISEIKNWNKLGVTDKIYPDDRLILKIDEIKSSTLN